MIVQQGTVTAWGFYWGPTSGRPPPGTEQSAGLPEGEQVSSREHSVDAQWGRPAPSGAVLCPGGSCLPAEVPGPGRGTALQAGLPEDNSVLLVVAQLSCKSGQRLTQPHVHPQLPPDLRSPVPPVLAATCVSRAPGINDLAPNLSLSPPWVSLTHLLSVSQIPPLSPASALVVASLGPPASVPPRRSSAMFRKHRSEVSFSCFEAPLVAFQLLLQYGPCPGHVDEVL